MKIHASYFILWVLGYIYTSALGVTAAHVDSWNMNSSWSQNYLSFWLNFSQFFQSRPCSCTPREHFYWKCTMDILPWSCLAMGVLIPMVTDPWGIFAKFRNSTVLWYCHPKFVSYGLATGAFGLALLILSHHIKSFSKKIMQFSQGEMSNASGDFHSASFLEQPDFRSDDLWGYGLLFQRPDCSTEALQHICNGTAATTLSVVEVGQ